MHIVLSHVENYVLKRNRPNDRKFVFKKILNEKTLGSSLKKIYEQLSLIKVRTKQGCSKR